MIQFDSLTNVAVSRMLHKILDLRGDDVFIRANTRAESCIASQDVLCDR